MGARAEFVRAAPGPVKRPWTDRGAALDSAQEGTILAPMSAAAAVNHFIRLEDLSDRQIEDILDLSARRKRGLSRADLAGRTVGLLFFRGSLRTRTSLVTAVQQLGGHTVNLTAASDFWELEARDGTVMDGEAPEHIRDAAAVMSMMRSNRRSWYAYENHTGDQYQYFAVGKDCALDRVHSEVTERRTVYQIVGKVDLETGVIFSLTPDYDVPKTNVHAC